MPWVRGKAYSQDLRERVFALADDDYRVCQVAEQLLVSVSYVSKVLSRRRLTGEVSARPQRCHVPLKLSDLHGAIAAEVAAKPDANLDELRQWLLGTHATTASKGLMFKTLAQLRLTHKKSIHAAEQARPDVAAARDEWHKNQSGLDAATLIFIDETWITTNMVRPYGRAPSGQRLVAAVPHGHWHISTFIGGLRQSGMVAPCVVDGPVDGEFFVAYIEQVLVPKLQPGDTVIMDNLSLHKVAGVKSAIDAAGAILLYLPPYSFDLNPIEMAFSKLKSLLRAKALRTMDQPWTALRPLLNTFSQSECRNYLRHAGYFQSA